jgi:hypothetical protein
MNPAKRHGGAPHNETVLHVFLPGGDPCADYAAWKITAGADLLEVHDVKPGNIPERLWRSLYIGGLSPQKAADQAAGSANNAMSPADRLKRLKRR